MQQKLMYFLTQCNLSAEKKKEATEHMIATSEDILAQIKEFSGEDDIERIAAQFVKQEEENFAIFNYVNELNNEVHIGLS
jgi:hypothetical protein